jgi:hypothetical protein
VTTQTQNTESASVRIVRGEPSAEELAALVAVLAARAAAGAGEDEAAAADFSGWTDRARYVRSPRVEFGARAGWRASALPR